MWTKTRLQSNCFAKKKKKKREKRITRKWTLRTHTIGLYSNVSTLMVCAPLSSRARWHWYKATYNRLIELALIMTWRGRHWQKRLLQHVFMPPKIYLYIHTYCTTALYVPRCCVCVSDTCTRHSWCQSVSFARERASLSAAAAGHSSSIPLRKWYSRRTSSPSTKHPPPDNDTNIKLRRKQQSSICFFFDLWKAEAVGGGRRRE